MESKLIFSLHLKIFSSLETNQGKAAAVQMILNEAIKMDADMLVLLDADFQHDPDEIPLLIKPISEDGYDLVLGSRKLYLVDRNGLKTTEVPITEIYTDDGSTLNPFKHGYGNLKEKVPIQNHEIPQDGHKTHKGFAG